MVKETWVEVRLLLPASMHEEGAIFLTEFSGRGVIVEEDRAAGGIVLRAFFRPEEFGAWQQEELQAYLRRLGQHGLFPLGLAMRQITEEDWAQDWKKHFKPLKVSHRMVIRPPWEDYEPGPEEVVITIYPGMAFGTGRHPTTALCLEALERVFEEACPHPDPSGWQVLDVGTGTGILALAAARLGARVLAIDVDPEAVAAALDNIRLNDLEDMILVETTSLNSLRQQFALIFANLTGPDLKQWAESLAGRLAAGGALIISGFLHEDLPAIMARFLAVGLQEGGRLSREEWGALVLRRPKPF